MSLLYSTLLVVSIHSGCMMSWWDMRKESNSIYLLCEE